jgi:tRNA (guanine-N7-)-methyltransferase
MNYRIRSFVRRDSRMTAAQRHALETLWPQWGLPLTEKPIDFNEIFGKEAFRVLEIGFGSGHSLLAAAKAHPEQDFIGIETHRPGIGALFMQLQAEKITNVRVYHADAIDVCSQCLPEKSFDIIQIFFPDPWPKRRHHKRRLIQTEFIKILLTKLKTGGEIHLATDWEDYASQMMKVLSSLPEIVNLAGTGNFASHSSQRPVATKFEQRGKKAGHHVWELQFVLNRNTIT